MPRIEPRCSLVNSTTICVTPGGARPERGVVATRVDRRRRRRPSARTGLVRSYEVTEPVPFTTPLTEELEVERSWAGLTELAAGRALL